MIRVSLLFALVACGSFIDRKAAETTLRIIDRSGEVAQREADVELARAALPGGLFQLEAFALAYPDEPRFKRLHAETLCTYAVAFVFDDWEDASFGGRDAAPVAARLDGLLVRCLAETRAQLPLTWTIATTTIAEAPSVLWLAKAGALRLAIAPLAHLAELPDLEAMLRRCIEVAPRAHEAGAELLLGSLLAGRAQMLGGPDGSAELAIAAAASPESLMVDVLVARGPALVHKDRALFERSLQKVLDADLARWPDHRLENELARRKAARYLAAEATLLPPSGE